MSVVIQELIHHFQHGDVNDWSQFGHIKAVQHQKYPELWILNYTQEAQWQGNWTPYEITCRGLILNQVTGEIVARPFDKFFNWMEKGRVSNGSIVSITEKMDGSLGILYRTPDGYAIATRGSFNSFQAEWGTDEIHNYYDLTGLPDEVTLLFEIIGPDNQVVIRYPYNALILIGARNRFTGDYLPYYELSMLADKYKFTCVQPMVFNNIQDIIDAMHKLDGDKEGWVVEFSDERFKFKGDQYVNLHRLVSKFNWKHFLDIYDTDEYVIFSGSIPDELMNTLIEWELRVEGLICGKETEVHEACSAIGLTLPRKEFALQVQAHYAHLSKYLFAMLDGKDIRPLILKEIRANAVGD